MGYLCARERGLPSNPQLLRVHEKRERAVIPRLYERGRVMESMTIEQLDRYKVALNMACFYLPPSMEKLKLELERLQELVEREGE